MIRSSRPSISETINISLGLKKRKDSVCDNTPSSHYLGRSYVGSFQVPNGIDSSELSCNNSNLFHESLQLHQQTAFVSNDFDESLNELTMRDNYANNRYYTRSNEDNVMCNKSESVKSKILQKKTINKSDLRPISFDECFSSNLSYHHTHEDKQENISYLSIPNVENDYLELNNSQMTYGMYLRYWIGRCINYGPAVILGLLLNILDGLSYGMIIFPITEPIFKDMGPTGLSMFYVSSIISQLIYSSGFSVFGSGVGSEMIEITPFFHTMALSITEALANQKERIISTTIVCYALSSIITGITFLILGKFKLGKIVGFFPRHILIGCIGGVGYFLIITGFEVTTRVSKFEYSWDFLFNLFSNFDLLQKWGISVILTICLVFMQHRYQNTLLLPSFYIIIFLLFHFIVAIVPGISLNQLREAGWIFQGSNTNENWFDFYHYYNPKNVEWKLIIKQLPTMFALSFFGILHVPINVPALAMSIGLDKFDINKELIAHGYSNLLSGCLGSIQNYLVYTNSVLFIRAGSDSSLSGILLAIATFIIMYIGSVSISFIPICIVGSLIFLLGYELIKEAIFDTWGKLNNLEYFTIVTVVLTMGIFDFVLGIIVGIFLACFLFLIGSTKLQTINGEFNGTVARSTVHRDIIQARFLKEIGEQVYILKLQNILFFGTIISIEEKIDMLFKLTDNDLSKERIKYLILDFKHINADNIDYSAAEGFNRIKRFLITKGVTLIISSIQETDRIYYAFDKVGLLKGIELFEDLNTALEWCENEFLIQYKKLTSQSKVMKKSEKRLEHQKTYKSQLSVNTPRNHQILSVGQNIFLDDDCLNSLNVHHDATHSLLPLLLTSLKRFRPQIMSPSQSGRTSEELIWSQLCPYFSKKRFSPDSQILHNNNIFFIIETGILKITHFLVQGECYETMSSKTCYGKISAGLTYELNFITTIRTETDCILWIIDSEHLQKLKIEHSDLYIELLLTTGNITQDRFSQLLGYSLVSN